jgi:hypothetical protein
LGVLPSATSPAATIVTIGFVETGVASTGDASTDDGAGEFVGVGESDGDGSTAELDDGAAEPVDD